ncbi:hypothetical protein KAS08_02960 [Candidatus Pacearchaeota archaeon]|nr:hypothetical protein [Candidatus Pacearchaeota archaeon]
MNEQTIRSEYIERPDDQIKLLCSYTTRREGFLDILLSKTLLSSKETKRLFGKTRTHRGSSMTCGGRESSFKANHEISFSTGFVSFKYSDPSIKIREDYIGGFGVFVPLDTILEHSYLGFSHCSGKGGIKDYRLNKDNIRAAVHQTRRAGELYDDGYGNVFEVGIWPEFDENESSDLFRKVVTYPRLALSGDVVVAIPENERKSIVTDVHKKQEEYAKFLDKIKGEDPGQLKWKSIDGRDLYYPEESISFMEKMLEPLKIDELPIFWYPQRNLDIALQRLAIL